MPLTLAQTGVVAAFKNTLVVGQGPRMAGIDPTRGDVRWEVAVGSPRGANEVERLADLVGPVAAHRRPALRALVPGGGRLRRRASAAALAWTKNVGGTDAIAGDAELLFGADASRPHHAPGARATGDVAWTLRGAAVPRPRRAGWRSARRSSFGDADGMLHWFSRAKGESQAARCRPTAARSSAPPVMRRRRRCSSSRAAAALFAFRPLTPRWR